MCSVFDAEIGLPEARRAMSVAVEAMRVADISPQHACVGLAMLVAILARREGLQRQALDTLINVVWDAVAVGKL